MRSVLFALSLVTASAMGQTLTPYPYNPAYITGAPYTARATNEINTNGQSRVETLVIARASDGKTYTSHFTGKVNWMIGIEDAPNHRFISLNPRNHTYTIQPLQPEWSVITVAQAAEALREQQAKPLPGPAVTTTKVLGEEQQMGFTAFGIDTTTTQRNGAIVHKVSWNTDFGVNLLSEHSVTGADGKVFAETGTVSDVVREEPNPSLFEIPVGYTEVAAPKPAGH